MLISKKNLLRILCLLALAAMILLPLNHTALAAKPTRTPKPGNTGGGPSPYDVLAAVNSIRTSNGLAAFAANGALMAAAQGHSNYMASIDSTSHSGAGGSDPKSRALASGYGGGADVSVIENIYGGMNASAQTAVNWWRNDGIHLQTILSTRHTEAGVGVAVGASGTVYFTLDVGVVVGGSAPAPSTSGTTATGSTPAAGAANVASAGMTLATAGPDGSVVHTVQEGQTLWTIAAMYKVDIDELLRINGLYQGSFITPGQKIIIRPPGSEPTAGAGSATPEAQETKAPKTTVHPTRTPVPTLAAAALAQSSGGNTSGAAVPAALAAPGSHGNIVMWVILGLVVSGGLLLLAGSLFGRAHPEG